MGTNLVDGIDLPDQIQKELLDVGGRLQEKQLEHKRWVTR